MPGITGLSGISGLSALFGAAYFEKVMASGPIVYFPLWEAAGSQADELINGWHGVHTGVTLGQPGIGDGYTSPYYDGATDYTNIYTDSLRDVFNGAEGTILIWAKVNAVGVWTDGIDRYLINLTADANNYVVCHTPVADNIIQFVYRAGGVLEVLNLVGLTITDWMCLGITWSKSAGGTGEVQAFLDGVQQGATEVGLGVWVGNLINTRTLIGAISTVPANVWYGWLGHGTVWDRPLTPTEMADLAVVE